MRIRSLLAAALTAGLLATGPTATFAAETALRTESVVLADAADISLALAPDQAVIADTKSPLNLTALVTNDGKGELPEGELTFELSRIPISSLAELTKPGDDLTFSKLGTALVGTTLPEKPASGSLRVAGNELPFTAASAAGTYLLRVSLVVDGAEIGTAVTPLVWKNAGVKASVDVSVIVPFVLPESITTMPTRGEMTKLVPGWSALLDAAESARATLAIDPRIVAGIRAYGAEAPQAARDFLAKLEASSAPSFLLQFADADVAVQSALGFTSLLEPTSLDFVTRHGTFPVPVDEADSSAGSAGKDAPADGAAGKNAANKNTGGTRGSAADANAAQGGAAATDTAETASDGANSVEAKGGTADGKGTDSDGKTKTGKTGGKTDGKTGEPVDLTPKLSDLLAWHGDTAAWPAEGDVSTQTLELLTRGGISSYVLDSSNVKLTGGPRATLEQGDAVITNARLSQLAAAALSAAEETERLEAQAKLAGELAVRAAGATAGGSGAKGVVIGLDRAAVADAEEPAKLLDSIAALDFVKPVRVADQQPGKATLKAAESLEERRAMLRSASDRELSVNEMGAVLVQPQYLSGYQRTRLLQLFATRYAPADGGFAAASEAFQARDAELLQGVQGISTEHTQLVGVDTSVPIQLHNSLPFAANVMVTAVPTSAAIEVKQQVFKDVKIGAGANERLQVPVHSRVSSGESGLVITVSAPSGAPTVFTGSFGLSIASNVETIALWIVGVMAGLLLAFGVVRSVRRMRRKGEPAEKGAEGEDSAEEGASEPAGSGASSAVDPGADSGADPGAGSGAGSPSGSPSADAE